MEEKKEIKVKFTTVIILILVLVIIGLFTYIIYNPKVQENITNNVNNEVIKNENVVDVLNEDVDIAKKIIFNKIYTVDKVTTDDAGIPNEECGIEFQNESEFYFYLGFGFGLKGNYKIENNTIICDTTTETGELMEDNSISGELIFSIENNKIKLIKSDVKNTKSVLNVYSGIEVGMTYSVKEENKISNDVKDETEEKEETTDLKGTELIQFDTEFYDIRDVAKVSKECEKVKNYVDYKYDLDGDGTKDKITMKKKEGEELFYSFKLNGKEFLEESAYGLYIADLNEDDNKLEVIIATYGGSDRICYMIYSKDGSKMKEIKNVTGTEFITDKKGKFVCLDFTMWITPSVYNEYHFIENGKATTKKLDMNEIKDIEFKLEPKIYYFSKKIDNFKEANLEDLKKSDIERLDKTTKCKIIKFVHDEDYSIDFIYVELSNGNKGYITTASGWFAD